MVETTHTPSLKDLPTARVVVVGDVIQDRWHYGRVERISPEAPVPVFLNEKIIVRKGGAGNVSANLSALGITGYANVLLGTRSWHKSIKNRFLVGQQQIFRWDQEQVEPLTAIEENDLYKRATETTNIGCLVLSDYGKGVLTPYLCRHLIRWARMAGIPVVVDPKGRDWTKYEGATVITPNETEFREMQISGKLDSLLVTKGRVGMELRTGGRSIDIPAQAREVFDVTGAGDTVVAVLAACLAVKFDLETAARIANAAAGVVVGKRGTATCSLAELSDAYGECVIEKALAETRKDKIGRGSMAAGGKPHPWSTEPHNCTPAARSPDGITVLEGKAEQDVIDMVRARLAEKKVVIRDRSHWERGWQENLEAFRQSRKVEDLKPRYIREGQPLRLDGKFVIADDPDYEWNWYRKFFDGIADRWLADAFSIWEYGSGSGHNIAALAAKFPRTKVVGLDWSMAAQEICVELGKMYPNVGVGPFDLLNPDPVYRPTSESVVLTVGAMEQTGRLWRPMLDFLLAAKPLRVVHIEPQLGWYDHRNPVDATAIEAHMARGFWTGYLTALRALAVDRRIKIEHWERTGFGSLMCEGYSQLVWRPL